MSTINKIVNTYEEALAGIEDNMTILVGGFGLCGIPEGLITHIKQINIQSLTIVSNNAGVDDFGLGILLQNKQIKKIIASYVGENKIFETQMLNKEIEVELTPQGTLAEKIRAGGAGIPAFFTPTGYGTDIAKNKEIKHFNGKPCILEEAITGDYAIIRAYKADRLGNLTYRYTAQNFNPLCAMAGKKTIVEVEHIVEVGELSVDEIITPGIYINKVIQGNFEKRIEKRTLKQ